MLLFLKHELPGCLEGIPLKMSTRDEVSLISWAKTPKTGPERPSLDINRNNHLYWDGMIRFPPILFRFQLFIRLHSAVPDLKLWRGPYVTCLARRQGLDVKPSPDISHEVDAYNSKHISCPTNLFLHKQSYKQSTWTSISPSTTSQQQSPKFFKSISKQDGYGFCDILGPHHLAS